MRAVIKRGGKEVARFEGEKAVEEALKTIMAISENPIDVAAALLVAAALAKQNIKGNFNLGETRITIQEIEEAS